MSSSPKASPLSAGAKVDCRDALAQLVAKNAVLKAAKAEEDKKLQKNYNLPFVKMNGDDWVRPLSPCGCVRACVLVSSECHQNVWCGVFFCGVHRSSMSVK